MKLNRIFFLYSLIILTIYANDSIDTRFNYFGNLSISQLNKDGYTLNNYNHDNVDNDASLTPYSKIGGQFTANYNDFTFTAQALARKNHGDLDAELTWFNLKYDLDENSSLKVGRNQTKILLNSDSIDIDYIHLWAKPPDEMYRILGINTFDGIEYEYRNYIGDYNYNIVLTPYGKSKKDLNNTDNTETKAILDKARAVRFTVENGTLTFQASYTKAKLNLPEEDPSLVALTDALSALGNDVSRYTYVDKEFSVWALGLKYDYENFIFNSEYARLKATSLLPDMKSYFVLFGYRFDKLTPYLMYAKNKVDASHFDTSDIQTTVATSYLKDSLNDVLFSTDTSQETFSIGFRYDIKPGLALKAQIDRTTTSPYGTEGSINKRGILEYELGLRNEPIYMYTMGLSFAF